MKTLTKSALSILADHHPRHDVQAALWMLYLEAPGLLCEDLARSLDRATSDPFGKNGTCEAHCLGPVLHPAHDLGATS